MYDYLYFSHVSDTEDKQTNWSIAEYSILLEYKYIAFADWMDIFL